MDSKEIKKYKGKTIANLKVIAQKWFNLYIRLRDTDENGIGHCISSGRVLKIPSDKAHAGHLYSAGHYPLLRFNEDNVHLQSKADNYFKGGNEVRYVVNLTKKIGVERVQKLESIAEESKRVKFKWDRFFLIETILKYKIKAKELAKTKNFKVNGL